MKMILIFTFLLSSCSSLKKSVIYSSMATGMLGATAGMALSPDEESKGANAVLFGLLGVGVGALAGYGLYKDDPRNRKLAPMIDEIEEDPNKMNLALDGINIEANLSPSDKYISPKAKLPKELEGKVKQQYLIKYQSKERYLNKGNKTYYIPAFDIYEHSYEEK